jgi:hypothetical protein
MAFSHWNDKLPAVGALAEAYRQKMQTTEYWAGLWVEDFLYQLLWRPSAECKRTPLYTGPSWSWSSLMNCTIWGSEAGPQEYKMIAEVKKVDVKLRSDDNPFGEVSSAALTLRSKIRKVLSSDGPVKEWETGYSLGPDLNFLVHFDVAGEELHPNPENLLFAIEMRRCHSCLSEKIGRIVSEALLLQQISKPSEAATYKRLGRCAPDTGWFDDEEAKEMDVLIV